MDCQYTDRIEVAVVSDDRQLQTAVEENTEYIQGETLAVSLSMQPMSGVEGAEHKLAGSEVSVFVKPVE